MSLEAWGRGEALQARFLDNDTVEIRSCGVQETLYEFADA